MEQQLCSAGPQHKKKKKKKKKKKNSNSATGLDLFFRLQTSPPHNRDTADACRVCRLRKRRTPIPKDRDPATFSLFSNFRVACFFADRADVNTKMLRDAGFDMLETKPPFNLNHLLEEGCQLFFSDKIAMLRPEMAEIAAQDELPVVSTQWISDFLLKSGADLDLRKYRPIPHQ